MIYKVNGNLITAYGYIWDGDGMRFTETLADVESRYNDVVIKLHTYGGYVFDGNIIANALKNSKANIELHVIGVAASMGAVISTAIDNVYMVDNGFLMIHSASGGCYGTATDFENTAKLLRSIEATFIKNLVKKTGKPEAHVKKWLTGDNWFDAKEALKEGLIKGIIDAEAEIEPFEPSQMNSQEVFNRFAAALFPTNQIKNSDNMKKLLIEALALTMVTEHSSDTAVIDAVKQAIEAKNKQLQTDLTAAQQKLKDLEEKVAAENKAAIDAEIKAAKDAGKITAEQIPTYEGIATASGVDALKTVLAAIPARKSIIGQVHTGKNTAPAGREDWDWDKWQKEDPKGFEAKAAAEPEWFQEMYNQKYKK